MEGLVKVACFIAAAVGGLFLLVGVLGWMQGEFSFWSSDIVPIPTATPIPPGYVYEPEVSIVWVEESFKSRRHRFSVMATNMDPSVEYGIRIHASTDNAEDIIGFNPNCSGTQWAGEFHPDSRENRTYDSREVTLYTCEPEGNGSMTVELLGGDRVHDSHRERVRVRDFIPR